MNQSSYSKINNGNIIPINDDIFIFCYPKDKAELINDDPDSDYYFLNYLVFWSARRRSMRARPSTGSPPTKRNGIRATTSWS